MKTILVDAIGTLVSKESGLVRELYELLEEYPNRKIILTNANDAEIARYLSNAPYELFTLKHAPEKTDPTYYKSMLAHFNLATDDVAYIEHNLEAVKSARSVGIETHHYVADREGRASAQKFLRAHVPQ